MLKELQISNFALIEELELSFYSGFSVLSGETGAGKSIIIDALSLLLGARASVEMIRSGAENTRVTGIFSHNRAAKNLLIEWGMQEDDELIITREINATGRNKCWINGHLATVGQLSALGVYLVDIVGQHDSQSLLNPQNHAEFLDLYGGEEHLALLKEADELASRWNALHSELNKLHQDEMERNRKIDLLTFQIQEITTAALQSNEDKKLEIERSRLANLDKIRQALYHTMDLMGENYDERKSILHNLSIVEAELGRALDLDSSLEPLIQNFIGLSLGLNDLYREFRDYLDKLPADPDRLDEIEARLDLIDGLKRKYGNTVEEIQTYLATAESELDNLANATIRAEGLHEKSVSILQKWQNQVNKVSASRKKIGTLLEKQIEFELADLSMENTRFQVHFTQKNTKKPSMGGQEELEFMLTPNIGEDLKPLVKIASGGELSRVMLAIKAVLIETEETPTIIFDEIDAGIGGRTAVNLGEKLQSLSKLRQVLCVTHLPVVASFGTHHYSVQKSLAEKRTSVKVQLLEQGQRVEELTRMLGGSTDQRVTLEHAQELLKKTYSTS